MNLVTLEKQALNKHRSSYQELVVRWQGSYGYMYLLHGKIITKIEALEYLITSKSKRS